MLSFHIKRKLFMVLYHIVRRFQGKIYPSPNQPHLSMHIYTAAAAAKLLQSCLTLWDPIDGSPPGSTVPGILQARTLEWVAISFSNAWKWKVKVKSLSRAWLLVTPWTAAYQAPPSMGFSRYEYWSGVLLPSLNMRQQKSHWCKEQSFGLCGRGRG